jgi:hypothetical protein
VVWDDSSADWLAIRVCVIRETWDYHHRLDEFLSWVDHVAARTILLNPPDAICWNTHKTYLRDLEARGVPVVPTIWLDKGMQADLSSTMSENAWDKVVVKPAVSADSYETVLVSANNVQEGQAHLDRLLAVRDMMVQPFLFSVQGYGERSLIFIAGEFTHAARRSEPFMEKSASLMSRPVRPTPGELDFASAVLGATPYATLYARVDIAPDPEGCLRLMELELLEPSLFLQFSPHAVERLATAIMKTLDGKS